MALMLLSLPAMGWLCCFWLARELAARGKINGDWRLSWALACVFWGLQLTLIVESSSVFRSFNVSTVAWAWCIIDVLLLGAAVGLARGRSGLSIERACRWMKSLRGDGASAWPLDARLYLGFTVFLVAFLFGLAVTLPTTNHDSLSYHLPRALRWIQQQSVDHFPTANTRQIESAPWSSFVMAILFLLCGSDRLVCLVQWFAMVSSLVVLCFIAEWLAGLQTSASDETAAGSIKARRRLVAWTCLVAVTIPIGVVEAPNPQTDYTAGFWLVCLIAFMLALISAPGNRWYALGAGLSCGLGVLTKATMFVYAAPVVALGGLLALWRAPTIRARVALAVLFTCPFLLLNAPHMLRNDGLFGSPLGSPWMFKIERCSRLTPATAASNVIRNLALHSQGGIPVVARTVNRTLAWIHQFTGLDLNEPTTTFFSGQFRFRERLGIYDSEASCFYHVVLILLGLAALMLQARRNRILLLYALPIVASFLLLCAYLKWQIWHTRLHLAYLLAFSPLVALLLVRSAPRWLAFVPAVALMCFAGVVVVRNDSRPFLNTAFVSLPRERQNLFLHKPGMNEPTAQVADAIARSGCRTVGLKLRWYEADYPLWLMLRNRGFTGEVHHLYVENESARLQTAPLVPDVIVTTYETPPAEIRAQFPFLSDHHGLLVLSTSDLSPGKGTVSHERRE